jgi:hypothetical protein
MDRHFLPTLNHEYPNILLISAPPPLLPVAFHRIAKSFPQR